MAQKPSYQHTLIWSSPGVEQYDEGEADDTRCLEIDSAEEVKLNTLLQSARYLQGLRCHYDRKVRPHTFQVGDLVLKRIQNTSGRHKLLSPWEGSFIVSKVTRLGSFELVTKDVDPIPNSWNIDQLQRFYA
jgi:hypothetical protein